MDAGERWAVEKEEFRWMSLGIKLGKQWKLVWAEMIEENRGVKIEDLYGLQCVIWEKKIVMLWESVIADF